MKLNQTITVQPPKYSDNEGAIVTPDPIIVSDLIITYIDSPYQKNISAQILYFPIPLKLWQGVEYDNVGDWTQKQAEDRVRALLGDKPEIVLRSLFPPTLEEYPNGPGSILSKMLSKIGIKSTPNCACKRHAINMNINGPDWCEQNVDTIVGWLRVEAQNRKLPFLDLPAKILILKAVAKSRKLLMENNNDSIKSAYNN